MAVPESGQDDGRYIELQLDGRQILIVAVGAALLCAVCYSFGRRVGRTEGVEGTSGKEAASVALKGEDAGDDLTFFDAVAEKRASSPPPPVVSGKPTPPASTGPANRSPDAGQPRAPSVPPRPSDGSGVQIQVAVLSDRSRAEALATRLRDKGYSATISPSSSAGRGVWRVRVGGYPSYQAARQAADRIEREERLKTWIPEGR